MADGVYDGVLPPDVPAGRCKLTIRLGTFDTADDADDKPEQRIPTGATLTLTPNVTGPVILPDGTIMVIKGTVLTSDTGEFDFWAIDGMRSSVNPTGWNWTATLKIDAATQKRFTFSPDSTSPTPINLGPLIPVSDPQTGVATVVGRGVASISVDPDTRHVLFVMSDDTTYDAGEVPPGPPGKPGDPGDPGDPGPPNVLTIGTVTQGTEADAEITGESPEQVLSLTLPKGDPGPPNSLKIGTVTQGSAAATITGEYPNQKLNLVVPKGDPGLNGSATPLTGTGFPASNLGVVGDTYIDTAATAGALVWRKWPTGWRVQEGDTGRRLISATITGLSGGNVLVRRFGSWITVDAEDAEWGNLTSGNPFIPLPPGFRPAPTRVGTMFALGGAGTSGASMGFSRIDSVDGLRFPDAGKTLRLRDTRTWLTIEAWPTALPGTPV